VQITLPENLEQYNTLRHTYSYRPRPLSNFRQVGRIWYKQTTYLQTTVFGKRQWYDGKNREWSHAVELPSTCKNTMIYYYIERRNLRARRVEHATAKLRLYQKRLFVTNTCALTQISRWPNIWPDNGVCGILENN